tara:strand:+ start:1032 stop:1148 length:117 start_codon:yes stop_codon:yes gene_type:complete
MGVHGYIKPFDWVNPYEGDYKQGGDGGSASMSFGGGVI